MNKVNNDKRKLIEAKDKLVRIIMAATKAVINVEEVLETLDFNEREIVKRVEFIYDEFDVSNSSIELQMLNYLNNSIFKRDSYMKRVIKAFIYYNSSIKDVYSIPSNEYVYKSF